MYIHTYLVHIYTIYTQLHIHLVMHNYTLSDMIMYTHNYIFTITNYNISTNIHMLARINTKNISTQMCFSYV